jgi:hypothetical protein
MFAPMPSARILLRRLFNLVSMWHFKTLRISVDTSVLYGMTCSMRHGYSLEANIKLSNKFASSIGGDVPSSSFTRGDSEPSLFPGGAHSPTCSIFSKWK